MSYADRHSSRRALRAAAEAFLREEAEVLRVARTIADLVGAESIEQRHVAEALQFKRALEDEVRGA